MKRNACGFLPNTGGDARLFDASDKRVKKAKKLADKLIDAGVEINRSVLLAAARLMDVAKDREESEKASSKLIFRQGYPKVAKVLGDQHDLPEEALFKITESTLLFLADKLTKDHQTASFDAAQLARAENLVKGILNKV